MPEPTFAAAPAATKPAGVGAETPALTLGLQANWRQFWLLVVINAFVGAMVGLERTVLPLIADRDFGLASKSAALSFVATFGIVKALTNFAAGRLGDRYGRKRVLIAGWLFGLPVPFLVIWAPSWSWIVAANVLLGVNQGLAWSSTVIMKIDLVGPRQRGLAMGLNEFAGYLAVACTALATGFIAERFGLRPEPFYLGIAVVALGLGMSLFFVRDTTAHARHETSLGHPAAPGLRPAGGWLEAFVRASWKHPSLLAVNQAGLVNNLNDGLAWGLFPLFFAASGLTVGEIGTLAFLYPATWGVAQLWTGALSDRVGRKLMITVGMIVQGGALIGVAVSQGFAPWLVASALLGLGTAMVYPALLAAVGDATDPSWRASAVGTYRFWRDLGYAVGALVAGVLADSFGMSVPIAVVGLLTALSGAYVGLRMPGPGRVR